jgi:hypothetical protein
MIERELIGELFGQLVGGCWSQVVGKLPEAERF